MLYIIITVLLISIFQDRSYAQTVIAPLMTPPIQNVLSSNGAPLLEDWNYIRLDVNNCGTKNVIDELQADGGGALRAAEIWIWDNNSWVNYTLYDNQPLNSGDTIAFYSNTKFFFDLDQKNCSTNVDENRQKQIEQVRNVNNSTNNSTGNFATELLQKIGGLFNGSKKDDLEQSETFDTDKAVNIKSSLNVIGETTLWNTTITGDFKAGQMSLNSLNNSLEIVGPKCQSNESLCETQTLYLQKNGSGNIDILDGKFKFQIDGTLETPKILTDTLNLKSTSNTTGYSMISKGTTEIAVETTAIKLNSKVFITPNTNTKGQVPYVKTKIEGQSFIVSIDQSIDSDIYFDWFIINID